MHSKRIKDALCHPGNLSLGGQTEGEDLGSVDDEYCHSHSAYLRNFAKISEKQAADRAFLRDFIDFVRRKDPKVLSAIDAIGATAAQAEAADWLGITRSEFTRMRTRLSQLAKCFPSGEQVPRQRRPYKKRIVKTKRFSASRLAA